MNVRYLLGGASIIAALALSACGETATNDGAAGSAAASGAAGGNTTLTVAADPSGQLAFQPTSLTAPAGQPLTVEFDNPSPLQHTWVLVEPGQEEAVNNAAQAGGGAAEGLAGVLETSTVVDGGNSETIEVEALDAGTYPFICTVPGHYAAGMKGTLTVQ